MTTETCRDCGRAYAKSYLIWQCSDTTCGLSIEWNEDGENHDDCINECLFATKRRLIEQLVTAESRIAELEAALEKAERELELLKGKRFPVLDGGMTVPWQMLVPHEPQAMKNHSGQTLETLAARCGLDWVELASVLSGKPYTRCPTEHAKEFVLKRVAEYESPTPPAAKP